MKLSINTFLFLFALIGSQAVYSQRQIIGDGPGDPVIVGFFGPTTAVQNETKQYTVSVFGGTHNSTTYYAWGGSIVTQSQNSVTVRWTSTGSNRYIRATIRVNGTNHIKTVLVNVSAAAPAMPSSPSVSSNNCGNKTLTRGNPPSGVTWYWQTSSNGTSTSNSSTTYSVSSTRTVYLRARGNSSGLWSSSRSKYVTVNQNPATPSAPSISTNTCGNKTLTRGNPPSGVTWYWQGTNSNGTSTSNSSQTYQISSSGTYYLRARNNSSGCWSSSRAITQSIYPLPDPPTPTISTNTCGEKVLSIASPPSGIRWYWQGTDSNGNSTTDYSPTYTVTESGTYYVRSLNTTIGCMGGYSSVAVTINTPAMPATPTTTSANPNSDNNNCGDLILTRGNPPSGVTWYWQGTNSNGTSTSNSSQTYVVSSSGTYYLRARNNSSGCWSSSRAISKTIYPLPDPPTPTVSTNECGEKVLSITPPPTGVRWYWQGTNASGFSISDDSPTYPVTESGTYYVRSLNTTVGCMGGYSSVAVIINTPPEMPATPTTTSANPNSDNNNCGDLILTRGNPPSGVTWYWQGTDPNGTSTINSSLTYLVNSSGNYYLRAQNNATGCWSESREISKTIYPLPDPPTPTVSTNECGEKVLSITPPPTGVRWYWQGTNASGFSISDDSPTYPVTESGTYYVRSLNTTVGCMGGYSSVAVTINTPPEIPATPTTTSANPNSDNNNCGDLMLTRGNPPSGVTWYWQGTDPNGTSTTNSSETYLVTASGNYYLRAQNNATGCWSESREISKTIFPLPDPPTPTVSTNECGEKVLSITPPPTGVRWYWQGTNASGFSISDDSPTYPVTESGTYYVRSLNTTVGCMGGYSSVAVTINTPPEIPATPTTTSANPNSDNNNCGDLMLTRGNPPSGVTWYWQGTDPNGTSTTNSSETYLVTASGNYYLRAQNNATGCWSESREISKTIFPLPDPPTPTVSTNECGDKILSITSPPVGVRWYWQGTDANGNAISDDGPTYTVTESGTYYVRSLNTTVGCMGGYSSVAVTVNPIPDEPSAISVSINQCGDKTLTKEYAPSGVTWYWQTTADGTSTANSDSNWTINSSGTYYLRAKNDNANCWSSSASAAVVVNEIPATPSVPSTSLNDIESHVFLSRGTPPTDIEWRWQGTDEEGTSTNDSQQYTASESGTYHIRAYNTQTGCWSPSTSVVVSVPETSYQERYNGNISAMRWKTNSDQSSAIYTFDYDGLNRLEKADYAWSNANEDYLQKRFHYSVPQITYDMNGNILSLERNGKDDSNITQIDELTYGYSGNQLQNVNDASARPAGFNNGVSAATEYRYDANGNMVKDLNKGIDTIYYNHLNLPETVILDRQAGDSIAYAYDAGGIKLSQTVYEAGAATKTTYYIGDFIYEDIHEGDGPEIELIQHEEGRIVPVIASDGETIEDWDYQYHLKDHLGNVRLTFGTTPESYTIFEDFEDISDSPFQDLNVITNANRNTTAPYGSNDKLIRLASGTTGAMIFLNLNKGDTIDLSVEANYYNAPTSNSLLATSYAALFNSFDNSFGSGSEQGVTSTSTVFDDALSGTGMSGKHSSNTAPHAFLNYIIFDKEMNYVRAGFQQVSTAAKTTGPNTYETISINDIIAEQNGYIFVYLSNENSEALNINFDDFTVYHGKTNVVSTQDYYPFGLTFNESVRVASTAQRYLYNGKELQEGTDWLDYGARMYMPALGRWGVADLLSVNHVDFSPYNFGLNNPSRFIDPDGNSPWDVIKAAFGYLNTPYEFGGKNPHYIGGAPKRMRKDVIGATKAISESYKVTKRLRRIQKRFKHKKRIFGPLIPQSDFYNLYSLNVPNGKSCGIDCSGLTKLAFNADPDKLMNDIRDGAKNQLEDFKNAESDGTGELHYNVNKLVAGDLVFKTNSKGEATHAMVATGQAKYDANGNIIQIEVIHSPSTGDRVKTEFMDLEANFRFGHTFRKKGTGEDKYGYVSSSSWQDFWSWVYTNKISNLIKK